MWRFLSILEAHSSLQKLQDHLEGMGGAAEDSVFWGVLLDTGSGWMFSGDWEDKDVLVSDTESSTYTTLQAAMIRTLEVEPQK